MISGLYLITDDNRDGRLVDRVAAALRGGAKTVQFRDKTSGGRTATAVQLRDLCRGHGARFILNDDPAHARDIGADGVHLGQGDMPLAQARQILGPGKLIGISTRTIEQALRAEAEGAGYIGLGSIYPTASKEDAVLVGVERLRQVRAAVALPIVAIGGITRDRTADLIAAGADAVAVVSAVMGDPDPALAAREIALQFNRRLPFPRGRVLTVAGSDSGGGAGIQADLKTITLLGGYGMSAVTALTAQNTLGVAAIHPIPAPFVAEQIETVLSDLGADVLKTGMLFSPEIVTAVARTIERFAVPAVVDPVMIAKGGSPLLQPTAVEALRRELLPLTYLLTPNLPEAEALTGSPVRSEGDMAAAARRLQRMGARHVLVKGGHLDGEAVDLLLYGNELYRFPAPRIETRSTHGTGCTYSAAIAVFLAQGEPLPAAVARAKTFIDEALRSAVPLGAGHGPVNHWQAARKTSDE